MFEKVVRFAEQDAEFVASVENGTIAKRVDEFALNYRKSRYKTLETGEKCRLVRPENICDAEIVWAPKKYDEIRKCRDDVKKIAQNTGWPKYRIERIKNHLFYEEHKLSKGIGVFDSDAEIASAWDRLYEGDFVKNDMKLLEHEYFESKFERLFKVDYEIAHEISLKRRPWKPLEK